MRPHTVRRPLTAPRPRLHMPEPTLRPASRRMVAPRPLWRPVETPTVATAVARLLRRSALHPWVWSYRLGGVATLTAAMLTLGVLVAPTLSADAAARLALTEAGLGVSVPVVLVGIVAAMGLLTALLFHEAVRIGRTYPPLAAERLVASRR